MDQLQYLLKGLGATDLLEQLAVLCALFYVVLISFKSQWGWLFATISSAIYIFICYFGKLYLETGLQVFYVAMAIYGWYEWSDADEEENEGFTQWSLKKHAYLIAITMILTFFTGLIFDWYTDQANPFLDAFTAMFSLVATYMVTKKVLENWLYWIVIDLVAMILYMNRGFELTAILYLLYSVIAVFGYFNWKRSWKRQC
jgi:nicotinamide mononucleotide transporter